MHEYGTTSEQLAWIRVAASHHAQHNSNALHRNLVSVNDVMSSPLISDPLHRLDCCVVSDGGGAVIVVREEIARSLKRPLVSLKGAGVALGYKLGVPFDITASVGIESGSAAYLEAGVSPRDIRYLSTYDSFTITVLMAIEDLGFCSKGAGGQFVSDGSLISGNGSLAVNTDGGGLCNNHPAHRGGITKIIEAVRQLRGEAHPAVQLPDLALAMAHGTGGTLDQRQGCATIILERE
jgi:acetyl-CoA C-acetyltransferase